MDTKKKDNKKISYKDYLEDIGNDLIKEAERIGNPCAFVKAKYGLDDKMFSAWLGNCYDGLYKQDHFCECYRGNLEKKRKRLLRQNSYKWKNQP